MLAVSDSRSECVGRIEEEALAGEARARKAGECGNRDC